MYDYVLQYGFDKETQKRVQIIKDFLKKNKIKDKERKWLPHITIDLYNCKNKAEFIKNVDAIIKKIKQIDIEFKNLNDFEKETLYIEPFKKEELLKLKKVFDEKLKDYRLQNRKERIYMPHITLCTNDLIEEKTYELANKKFKPFSTKIKYIWIYNQQMDLIKEYQLEF